MKCNTIVLLLLLWNSTIQSQSKAGSKWIIGGSFATEASFTDTSRPVLKIKYDTSKIAYPYYYTAGHSNICDSATGKLLFSTTGMLIHDTSGAVMDNGDSLVDAQYYDYNFYPSKNETQGSLILPKGSNGQYYVFITNISDSAWNFYVTNQGGGGCQWIGSNTM